MAKRQRHTGWSEVKWSEVPCPEEQTSVWPEARVPQSSRRPLSSRWPPRCKREDEDLLSLSLKSRKQTPAPISFLFASRPGSLRFALHGGQPAKAQHHQQYHHYPEPPVHLLTHQHFIYDQLLPSRDTWNCIAEIYNIKFIHFLNVNNPKSAIWKRKSIFTHLTKVIQFLYSLRASNDVFIYIVLFLKCHWLY